MKKVSNNLIKKFDNDLTKLEICLSSLNDDFNNILSSDLDPIWNGTYALNTMKKSKKQLEIYYDLLNKLNDCYIKLEK